MGRPARHAADDGRHRAAGRVRVVVDAEALGADVIRSLEYASVRIVAAVVSLLPMRLVRTLGTGLGRLAYALDAGHRRIALENLAAAFPSRPPAEHRVMARAMFAHF